MDQFRIFLFVTLDWAGLVAAVNKREGDSLASQPPCQSPPGLAISWVCVSPLILIIRTEEGDDGGRGEDTGEIDKSSGENIIRKLEPRQARTHMYPV